MTAPPDLDRALAILTDITEAEEPLRADDLLVDTGLDSLDVLEFMYELGIEADDLLDNDELMGSLESMTIGQLYTLLIEADRAASADTSAPAAALSS